MDAPKNHELPDRSISEAEPYRTPSATSDSPRRSSLFGWLTLAGILLGAAVAVGYARFASEEDVSDHIRQFGGESRRGLEEPPWDLLGPTEIDGAAEGATEP